MWKKNDKILVHFGLHKPMAAHVQGYAACGADTRVTSYIGDHMAKVATGEEQCATCSSEFNFCQPCVDALKEVKKDDEDETSKEG